MCDQLLDVQSRQIPSWSDWPICVFTKVIFRWSAFFFTKVDRQLCLKITITISKMYLSHFPGRKYEMCGPCTEFVPIKNNKRSFPQLMGLNSVGRKTPIKFILVHFFQFRETTLYKTGQFYNQSLLKFLLNDNYLFKGSFCIHKRAST